MAKFHGKIGYAKTVETAPGVHQEIVEERFYVGDILKDTKKWENGVSINDNLNVSNSFSIVADSFSSTNLHNMRYIIWAGVSWRITSVEVRRPRLILTIGGIYNGPKN